MRATLDSRALKPFTKALLCLSKYGEDLNILATSDGILLSTTNSSLSAYCRFKYSKSFFSKYVLHTQTDQRGASDITGQLLTKVRCYYRALYPSMNVSGRKSLLSVLRHRNVDKMVDRCELSIIEAQGGSTVDDERDSLESKLVVRLHCKHGIVKTHRLLLQTPTSFMAPGDSDSNNESNLTIGPRTIKDMLEHFPSAKADLQLTWIFAETEVGIKSSESSLDSRGKPTLSTELSISAEEFDTYEVYAYPTTIAFHLREFFAAIIFAESMGLALGIRFTDPANPLSIDVESDSCEALFVISTNQLSGHTPNSSQAQPPHNRSTKRDREGSSVGPNRYKKPMKAAQRSYLPSEPVANLPPSRASLSQPEHHRQTKYGDPQMPVPEPSNSGTSAGSEPLFLPTSSQLSFAEPVAIRNSEVEIKAMSHDDFESMMEADGEEISPAIASPLANIELDHAPHLDASHYPGVEDGTESLELVEDVEMAPSQIQSPTSNKDFRPLFED